MRTKAYRLVGLSVLFAVFAVVPGCVIATVSYLEQPISSQAADKMDKPSGSVAVLPVVSWVSGPNYYFDYDGKRYFSKYEISLPYVVTEDEPQFHEDKPRIELVKDGDEVRYEYKPGERDVAEQVRDVQHMLEVQRARERGVPESAIIGYEWERAVAETSAIAIRRQPIEIQRILRGRTLKLKPVWTSIRKKAGEVLKGQGFEVVPFRDADLAVQKMMPRFWDGKGIFCPWRKRSRI